MAFVLVSIILHVQTVLMILAIVALMNLRLNYPLYQPCNVTVAAAGQYGTGGVDILLDLAWSGALL